MTLRSRVDVAILGGGTAGLAAAREARRRGASAVLVNDGPLGGDCTFTGCVPSKTVIEAALAGLSFPEAFDRARSVIDHIAATENADVLRSEGVDVIESEGTLLGVGRIRADSPGSAGRVINARGVVLALGSRPGIPTIPGLGDVEALTSETLWELKEAPASMIIVGGGAIGCELGQALARLGVSITIVELAPRLLSNEEPEAAAVVEEELRALSVAIHTGVGVASAERSAAGVELTLADGTRIEAERILVAAGRTPNSDRAGLAQAGIELDERGYVSTDDDLATNLDTVYASGDLTGRVLLTHAADAMGRLAAGNILRRFGSKSFNVGLIPAVTFTTPEVASVGLSEAEAAAAVKGARVAYLPLEQHDRALAASATNGYIKLIAAPVPLMGHTGGGRLIGATIVAERAGEMIAELALAVRLRLFTGLLATTVHPYPTWSYGIPKAAVQFFTTIEGRTARPASFTGQLR